MTLEDAVEWCKDNRVRVLWQEDGQVALTAWRDGPDPSTRPVYRVVAADLPAAVLAAQQYVTDNADSPFGMPGEMEIPSELMLEAKQSLVLVTRAVGAQDVLVKRNALDALVRWTKGA